MLNLYTYNFSNDLYLELSQEKSLFVVPGPDDADKARKFLPDIEVITIANFIRKYSDGFELTKKSELMQYLARIWKKLVNSNYTEFQKYFRYFTEIRNNTTSFELFSEIAETFELPYSQYFITSYQLMDSLDIHDEYSAYQNLKSKIHKIKTSRITFLNFKFFNSSQLNFFEELAMTKEVVITLPQYVWENCHEYSWPKFLSYSEKFLLGERKFDLDCRVLEYNPSERGKINLNSFEKIYQQNWSEEVFSELNVESSFVKIPFNVLNRQFIELFEYFGQHVGLELTRFKHYLQTILKNAWEKREHPLIKAIALLREILEEVFDSESDKITRFDISLCKEIFLLDMPRDFLVSFSEQRQVLDFNPFYLDSSPSICFVNEPLGSSSTEIINLPASAHKALSSLGFFKSHELDQLFKEAFLLSFASEENHCLFVRKNVFEENENLKPFFIDFETSHFQVSKVTPDYLSKHLQRNDRYLFSASKIQSFIDCPRKYHFSYHYQFSKPLIGPESFKALEEGNLIHKTLEEAYLHKKEHDEIWLRKFINEYLESEKKLSSYNKVESVEVSLDKIESGITAVDLLKNEYLGDGSFEFEKKINQGEFNGSIDFLINSDDFIGVIDFKRSKQSIPSKIEILEFKKIQLAFYLRRVQENLSPNNFLFGYISLERIEDSIFFYSPDVSKPSFGKSYELDCLSYIEKYGEVESSIVEKIKTAKEFIAKPIMKSICDYCEINYLCQKN